MASRVCLVHYHEIGLKGNNRARFERILMDNIKAALAAFSVATITRISGHILVTFSVRACIPAYRQSSRGRSRLSCVSYKQRAGRILRCGH